MTDTTELSLDSLDTDVIRLTYGLTRICAKDGNSLLARLVPVFEEEFKIRTGKLPSSTEERESFRIDFEAFENDDLKMALGHFLALCNAFSGKKSAFKFFQTVCELISNAIAVNVGAGHA
jgi:hypothetical protein